MESQNNREKLIRRPVVGLALGGGGARGLAHIGILKVLEEAGVPVDLVAGTSMGGIIAAAYAAGLSAFELEDIALEMSRPRNLLRLVDVRRPRSGLLSGKQVRAVIEQTIGGSVVFADLVLPLGVVAVDLITGEEVVLTDGDVSDAVRATSAFPAVFEPVDWPPYRLVDGGVLNNVPADVARKMGAEAVIAVDVGLDFYDLDLVDNPSTSASTTIAHNAWRSQSLASAELVRRRIEAAQPEIVLHPHISGEISAFNGFTRAQEIIAAGEEAAEMALPDILRETRARLILKKRPVQSRRA